MIEMMAEVEARPEKGDRLTVADLGRLYLDDLEKIGRKTATRRRDYDAKSRRSQRAVPMPDEVAGELNRLFKASSRQADDDLVFADTTGNGVLDEPFLNKAAILRRYKRAKLDDGRFHDRRHTYGTEMAAGREVGIAFGRLDARVPHPLKAFKVGRPLGRGGGGLRVVMREGETISTPEGSASVRPPTGTRRTSSPRG
jgi:hypothetical protein